ncbi:unnamed protein product [Lampetra fluviatilis]
MTTWFNHRRQPGNLTLGLNNVGSVLRDWDPIFISPEPPSLPPCSILPALRVRTDSASCITAIRLARWRRSRSACLYSREGCKFKSRVGWSSRPSPIRFARIHTGRCHTAGRESLLGPFAGMWNFRISADIFRGVVNADGQCRRVYLWAERLCGFDVRQGVGDAITGCGEEVVGGAITGFGEEVVGDAITGCGEEVVGDAITGCGEEVVGRAITGFGEEVVGDAITRCGEEVVGDAITGCVGLSRESWGARDRRSGAESGNAPPPIAVVATASQEGDEAAWVVVATIMMLVMELRADVEG